MRRVVLIVVTAFAVALAGRSSSEATTKSKKKYSVRIGVVTRATEINDFVDTGPTGPSPGDLYVFEDQIFKTTKSDDPDRDGARHVRVDRPSRSALPVRDHEQTRRR